MISWGHDRSTSIVCVLGQSCFQPELYLQRLKKKSLSVTRPRGWEEPHAKTVAWSHDMEGHAFLSVDRCSEPANKKPVQLYRVSTHCLDDHNFKKEDLETVA